MIEKLLKDLVTVEADAVIVLRHHPTGRCRVIFGRNIVTNEGDKFYAQSICGETPTNDFVNIYQATSGPATVAKTDAAGDFSDHAGGEKAPEAGYPQTNDPDTDNTESGVDVVSWKFAYATTDGPFTGITHSFVAEAGIEHTVWATGTAYSLGDYVVPTTLNGFIYECTTAGTSDGTTEPTWPTTVGGTVTDGTVVWTCRAGHILNSYEWAAAWDKDSATSAKIFANHEMLGS